ncbi:hypothetical protein I7I51_03978 [Histoplasma capsulatum]|uniref:Uncharacterized protein n=1 Tax=Ajellomyces capsulatus TaxID=5037 RepID=A0A8A1M758_AJECA|nr:hypothetical protein I7I51_03978 [Histoplasma capsulatum]
MTGLLLSKQFEPDVLRAIRSRKTYPSGLTFVLGASVFVSLLALSTRELRASDATQCQSESKPGSETATHNDKTDSDDDGDIRKALAALNESAMADLQCKLPKTVLWADLSTLFTRWGHI